MTVFGVATAELCFNKSWTPFAIPTASVLHRHDFDFPETTTFESYGVTQERKSQYANKH